MIAETASQHSERHRDIMRKHAPRPSAINQRRARPSANPQTVMNRYPAHQSSPWTEARMGPVTGTLRLTVVRYRRGGIGT